MTDPNFEPDDDAWLLEHADWLRALCQRLVHGSDAGDLAQDTLAAAIRTPPGERARLRAWLARIARNKARSAHLRKLRREARERTRARPEALPSPAEVAENLNVQRAVVAAISALEEPYRSTLVHRYYEGLSSSEIARRQGLPAPTVRSRLRRAHALVRRSLQLELGDSDWAVAVLPLAFPGLARGVTAGPTSLTTVASVAGAIAMKKVVLLAAVVLSVIAGSWWIARPDDVPDPDTRDLAVVVPDAEQLPTRPAAPPQRTAGRAEVPAPAGAPVPRTGELADGGTGTLEVSVEPPAAEGRVLLRLSPSGGIFDWWSSSIVERELVGGRAVFSGLPLDHFALIEVHLTDRTEGLPWTHECSGPTNAEPDVVVRCELPDALPVLTGRLVDGAGTPQRLATVLARLAFPREMPAQFSRAWDGGQRDRTILTDEDGRFAYPVEHRFMEGTRRELLLRPRAGGDPLSIGGTASLDLSRALAAGVQDVGDVRLRTSGRISGAVRDEAGHGVPRARISVWRRTGNGEEQAASAPPSPGGGIPGYTLVASLRTTTDSTGRFVVGSPDDPLDVVRLRVEASGFASLESEDVAPGTEGLDLFLPHGFSVHGHVLVDDGIPFDAVRVRIVEERGEAHSPHVDARGTFRCAELRAGPVQLTTYLDGERLDGREVTPAPNDRTGSTVTIDLRGLARPWRLRFLGEGGEPVPLPETGALWVNLSDTEGARPYWLLQKRVDGEGRCSFALPAAIERVRVTLPGYLAA
ncbi:MAG: sigma-70 family RNA polymerase sigma factor, partial [Planctomycetota bacterium]